MPDFKRSELTNRIVNHLKQFDAGTAITYKKLTDAMGEPITTTTPSLRSAFNIMTRQNGAVWICVRPRVGIRRLTDVEIVQRTQPFFVKGASRKLKRGKVDAENVEYGNLSLKEQAELAIALLQMESAMTSLSRSTRIKLENIAAKGNFNDLPRFNIAELAGALGKHKQ